MSQNLENLRDGPPGKISSTHGITILKDTLRITSEMVLRMSFKGSSDPNDFIFEINVGKKRIRYTATLK